ncbi:serine/threonine protein kinase [Leucobacter sp. cx-42]|uniref:serine/threonine-protein kinase n=1 Tax=unclassified Leucobacter TaxID=2621730 RepID=UPI00165E893E|nr:MULTISPECIES: serine/threonine-protein kinase [unclassified Leucobacter]MBC9953704.1 serine/threonine protein kinase [Leucobacter sp. cx-42]
MARPQAHAPQLTGYALIGLLGTGGYAQVFQYEQNLPRRSVAVKVLEASLEAQQDRSMFEAEANVMGLLSNHPSIVTIYSASVAADGRPYIAMEYCPGSFRAAAKGSPMTLDRVLDAGVRIAGALESAHRSGVLHRDIKPANVLLGHAERPLLTDFGIASLRGNMRGERTELAMSPQWAAPEVLSLQTSGTVASEVWSLGATLYGIAAGHPPFASPDPEQNTSTKLRERVQRAVYVPVPGAQGYGPFDRVIQRALSRDPRERYGSMLEFGEALRGLQRAYGYDLTVMDVVDFGAAPEPAGGTPLRPSSVRAKTRAERREEMRSAHTKSSTSREALERRRESRDSKRGLSPLACGVVGVVIGVALMLTANLTGML